MNVTVHIQRTDEAEITTSEYPDFATTSIEGDGGRVALFFANHAHAELVAAALRNDHAALRAMLGEPPEPARCPKCQSADCGGADGSAECRYDEEPTQQPREPDDDERPEEPSPDEVRRMKALYEGEKAAGLHKSRDEYEADLRDAGRGHLIRR